MSDQPDPRPELDDENGIAAQATRQGGDFDAEAPLPDDGSGVPLTAEETLSAQDDADRGNAADEDLEDQDDDEEEEEDEAAAEDPDIAAGGAESTGQS